MHVHLSLSSSYQFQGDISMGVPSDDNVVGTIKVSGHLADVVYIGGSTFHVVLRDGNEGNTLVVRQSAVDKWVKSGKMRLTNAPLYKKILDEIDPVTGDTPTHHADGTEKTLVERELSSLQSQGLVSIPTNDGNDAKKDARKESTPTQRKTGIKDNDPMTSSSKPIDTNPTGTVTSPAPMKSSIAETTPMPPQAVASPFDADDNGKPHALPARTKSPQLVAYVIIMFVIAMAALFGGRALTEALTDGDISNGVSQVQNDLKPKKHSDTQASKNENKGKADDKKVASNANNGNYVKRTDFDPETSVKSFSKASDSQRDTATKMFEYIRQLFSNGDASDLTQAVNLDGIASQIAESYAKYAQEQQGLTDSETMTLRDYYKQAFEQEELDNASKNDIYGSIFGGRIRDVHVDGDDQDTLYVVMESLGGDHQRVCFVLKSSDNGSSWIVNGITDADGYVKQIMEGDTSKYEKSVD
jgi:hypothetical protein